MADPVWQDNVTPLNAVNMTKLQTRDEKNVPSGYVGLDAASNAIVNGSSNALSFNANQNAASGTAFAAAQLHASGYLLIGKRTGDAQWRLLVASDGGIQWGDGTGGADTTLYRAFGGGLGTSHSFLVGDSVYVDTNGGGAKLYFGATGDSSIRRDAATSLRTESALTTTRAFWVERSSSVGAVVGGYYPGEANSRVELHIGDGLWFGPGGTTPLDTNLFRGAANQLNTPGTLFAGNSIYSTPPGAGLGFAYLPATGGGPAFYSTVSGESNARFRFSCEGRMDWGPGGATGGDTNLYRAAAGTLRTDGTLFMGGGAVVDAANVNQRLFFGSALDTSLYRFSAGTLKTDGILNAVGGLQINGVPVGAGGGGELAYAEVTSPVSITALNPASATVIVSASATAFDGTPVMIEFFTPYAQPPAGTDIMQVMLFQDGSLLAYLGQTELAPGANPAFAPMRVARRMTPSAGSHTYSIRAYCGSGSGIIQAGAGSGGAVPAFIRITKV